MDTSAPLTNEQGDEGWKTWLSVKEIQAELGIGSALTYRIVHQIPHARVGGLIRVSRADLERAMRDGSLATGSLATEEVAKAS